MEQIVEAGRVKIDQASWERRELFALFGGFTEPHHGVCMRLDCTETLAYSKDLGVSFFLSLLHRSLAAAQALKNFRTVLDGGEVWLYDRIDGGSAVGRPNGTIGFGHYSYRENLQDFVREGMEKLAEVRDRVDLERPPHPNLIRYSTLPWFDFTSISHARNLAQEDSSPRITFGKLTDLDGRRTMPVSIHVHHGLADGSHVAEYVERFQRLLRDPEELG